MSYIIYKWINYLLPLNGRLSIEISASFHRERYGGSPHNWVASSTILKDNGLTDRSYFTGVRGEYYGACLRG